mgnify:CR=1 FL=1
MENIKRMRKVVIIMMGIVLMLAFSMPTYAADDLFNDNTDDGFTNANVMTNEDSNTSGTNSSLTTNGTDNTNSNTNSNNTSNTNNNVGNTNNTNNTNNNTNNSNTNRNVSNNVNTLAKTGISDNSGLMLVIVIAVISAIYSLKKVNDYKKI